MSEHPPELSRPPEAPVSPESKTSVEDEVRAAEERVKSIERNIALAESMAIDRVESAEAAAHLSAELKEREAIKSAAKLENPSSEQEQDGLESSEASGTKKDSRLKRVGASIGRGAGSVVKTGFKYTKYFLSAVFTKAENIGRNLLKKAGADKLPLVGPLVEAFLMQKPVESLWTRDKKQAEKDLADAKKKLAETKRKSAADKKQKEALKKAGLSEAQAAVVSGALEKDDEEAGGGKKAEVPKPEAPKVDKAA